MGYRRFEWLVWGGGGCGFRPFVLQFIGVPIVVGGMTWVNIA